VRPTLILTAALVLLAPVGARAAGENDPYRDDGTMRYRFYTGGELLYMERDGTPDVEVTHNIRSQCCALPPIVTEVIGTDDVIDDDEEFGGRLFLGMRLNRSSAVEAVYMGWGHSRSTSAFSPFEDLNAFEFPDASSFADGAFDDAAVHDLEFDSEFHSGEINYRHAVQVDGADYRFNLLAGLRGIRLEENLDLTSWDSVLFGTPPPAFIIGEYDISTRNTLIGAQVGVETFVPLWADRLDLDLYFVAGGYANQTNIYVDSFEGNSGTRGRQSEIDWEPAAVIESAIHLNVRLWRGVKMTLGYRAIYINNIAAAAEQFPRSGSPGDTNKNFDVSSDTVFHGASLGLGIDF